ncbi:DNA-formamidopyrimidine glycosylase family protein [Streptomyces sp. NPDC019396]|uniref:DNA-formamidopyrimidine glycosylase family protein n=1 Tax=Streptomyces sp. NPDC019396 TaxID=3154687 RepID=UPI003403C409
MAVRAETEDEPTIVCHFGMTGSLRCCSPDTAFHAHDRIVLTFEGSRRLCYRDQRKLQGIRLADAAAVGRILGRLGPDALDVNWMQLRQILHERRGAVKSVLMDQSVVAGLGNLLCDEVLWRA